MPRIFRSKRSAHRLGRARVVTTVAAITAVMAIPAGSALAAGTRNARITQRSSTPPQAILRTASRAARRAAHHPPKGLAHTASATWFALSNPAAQCYAPGFNGSLKTLSISGPRVWGGDYSSTVYWRPAAWRVGATTVELEGNTWHAAAATPTQPAVFAADSFNFFGYDLYWQQWQAGVEIYRYSPARGWEYGSVAFLSIKHTIDSPFSSTSYSTSC